MSPVFDTLTQTYELIHTINKPYPPEIGVIFSMFVSPEHIKAFQDHALYLDFIQILIDNRENVAFPEEKASFTKYFEDCIALKEQMEKAAAPFSKQDWLSYCIRLLENLKTPYYPVYSSVLFDLEECFPDRGLFDQTLRAFYTVIIRSSEDSLALIRMITEHGRHCYQQGWIEGRLLSDLLIHQLSVYANGKDLWTDSLGKQLHMEGCRNQSALLSAWFSAEDQFMEELASSAPEGADGRQDQAPVSSGVDGSADRQDPSLASWLAAQSQWLSLHLDEAPAQDTDTDVSRKSSRHLSPLTAWNGSASHPQIDSTFLNTFAYNMNARSYITNPAIGREQELKDLELILISPKKSPILIGESGVGKTSVVEGLAWLLQRGEVPELLKKKTIFKLTTTSLLSGTKYVGEMEDRIKQLTGELEKYPDVILFIDEIHTIVGAGSTESSHNDISNMLKPFIDRGDIKIIGATTIHEYEAYLLPDRALARRFYPIGIDEPDDALTLKILQGTIPAIEQETRVRNGFSEEETDALLTKLIRLSDKKNQPENRLTRLPELPLTILEMAFSYAAMDSRKELMRQDLVLAVRHTNLLTKDIRMKAEEYFPE